MATNPAPQQKRDAYRDLREAGLTLSQIAERFNTSKQAVCQALKTGATWGERQKTGLNEYCIRREAATRGSDNLLEAILTYYAKHHRGRR